MPGGWGWLYGAGSAAGPQAYEEGWMIAGRGDSGVFVSGTRSHFRSHAFGGCL